MATSLYFDGEQEDGADNRLFLCVFRDLTDESAFRQGIADQCFSLERANYELQRLSQLKNGFLANMSHEVRTPMMAILGHAEGLLEGPMNSNSEAMDSVCTILQNGEHLLEILNDIFDLSKIEAGKLSVEKIPCSLFQIMADVESLMQARAQQKGLELQVVYFEKVPETIHTDPTRLRQILLNLVGNAIKFTSEGVSFSL